MPPRKLLRSAGLAVVRPLSAFFNSLYPVVLKLQGRLALLKSKLTYEARPDDVFVVTYPKSGTTWAQMILYQLTSDGDMGFPHIGRVVPHVEEFAQTGHLHWEALPSPRIFKSHLSFEKIYKGRGKYVYVMRDGRDVAVSYYRHYQSYQRFDGSFEAFFEKFLKGDVEYGSWFEHVASWLAAKDALDVLYLRYEDLMDDLEGSLRRIIAHCGLAVDDKDFPRILERCSLRFMKEHEEKFDLAYGFLDLAGMVPGKFLRGAGESASRPEPSAAQRAAYAEVFERHLGGLDAPYPSS